MARLQLLESGLCLRLGTERGGLDHVVPAGDRSLRLCLVRGRRIRLRRQGDLRILLRRVDPCAGVKLIAEPAGTPAWLLWRWGLLRYRRRRLQLCRLVLIRRKIGMWTRIINLDRLPSCGK